MERQTQNDIVTYEPHGYKKTVVNLQQNEEACECTMSKLQALLDWCKNITFGDKTTKNVKKTSKKG